MMIQHQRSLERLGTERLGGEQVEAVSAFLRELLGMYVVYLLPSHDESFNPNEDQSVLCKVAQSIAQNRQFFGVSLGKSA